MKKKIITLFFSVAYGTLSASSDISAVLTCLKPHTISLQRSNPAIQEINAQSDLLVRVPDDTCPTLVFFEEDWHTAQGKTKLLIKDDELLKMFKSFRFKEDGLVVKKHSVLEGTDDTSYLSDLKGDGLFFKLSLNEDGQKYITVHFTPSYGFDRTLFQRNEDFEALKSYESSIPFIQNWCSQHPEFKHNLQKFHSLSLVDDDIKASSTIPKTTHTILTKTDDAFESFYVQNNLSLHNTQNGWQHILWVLDQAQIPEDFDTTKNKVEIRFISDLFEGNQQQFEHLMRKSYYEISCYLRYFILNRFGGWYIAPDVELIQPLDRFSEPRFVGLVDAVMKPCLSVSLLGSVAHHPVLESTLQFIGENHLENERTFGYGKMDSYISFGVCLFSHSFQTLADPSSDLVLSFNQFPTFLPDNPIRMVSDSSFKPEIGTIAVHFSDGEWRDE
jgi:hypothetical protein